MNEELFHKAVHMACDVFKKVTDADMAKPTPCSEWDVRALMNHIAYEVAWVTPLVTGKTIAEVGSTLDGDLLGDKPYEAFQKIAQDALDAANSADNDKVVHLSYGDKTADAYVDEVGGDVVVHTWDLAKAIGADFKIDDATAAEVLKATEQIMPGAKQIGLIGEALPVADGASAEDKLLAMFGRQSEWTA